MMVAVGTKKGPVNRRAWDCKIAVPARAPGAPGGAAAIGDGVTLPSFRAYQYPP